jgi:hypothetical protein
MKIPFMPDAPAALEKAKRRLDDVEANVAQLQASRIERLKAEDIGAIVSIDKAIEAEKIAAGIYRDKIDSPGDVGAL